MIVECENCNAKFKLDDSKITEKGIKVRCSKCKHVFTVKKPSDTPNFSIEKSSGDDPFQDFSFSDDIDLGGGDSEPASKDSTERPPERPSPAPEFSLGNNDDLGGEAPGQQASGGDLGDFNFDEEGSDTPAPPQDASSSAPKNMEWGEVSFSDDMPQVPDDQAAAADDFDFGSHVDGAQKDEESFGDFKFDDGGEMPGFDAGNSGTAAREGDIGGFVRSEKSRAPVRDELEASLDTDTDSAAPAPVAAPREQPAKPVIRHEPKEKSKTPFKAAFIALAFIAFIVGSMFYTNSQGTFTFGDLTSGNFGKLKDVPVIQKLLVSLGMMEEPDLGTVSVVKNSVKYFQLNRPEGGSVLVFSGIVQNTFRKAKSFIEVEVNLYDEDKELIMSKRGYCDVTFTEDELSNLDRQTIEKFMSGRSGRTMSNVNIGQDQTLPFTVVFFNVDISSLKSYKAEVSSYLDADAEEALDVDVDEGP